MKWLVILYSDFWCSMVDKRHLFQVLPFAVIAIVILGFSMPFFTLQYRIHEKNDAEGYLLGYKVLAQKATTVPYNSTKPYVNLTLFVNDINPATMDCSTLCVVHGISSTLRESSTGSLRKPIHVSVNRNLFSITNKSPTINTPFPGDAFLYDGTIAWYPFDTYRVEIELLATTGTSWSDDGSDDIDINVRLLQHQDFVWNVNDATVELNPDNSTTVSFTVARDFNMYIVLVFTGMWAVTLSIAYIGCMAVIWKRRAPDNPVIFISALFAVPAFRNSCPGNPPYGVLFDVFSTFSSIAVISTFLVLVSVAYMHKSAV
ncbi:Aste57867_14609 [Aphanomyces stellatus]|uniref:Aste57867_14609 protein n=1 Tax=Aphanomyces stellatus TaxID=120398 RepID=A0A485L1X7_9STRA|nr:hypothetical protein As57867_014555 [Aphanomyces stellatus]VFT91428.1 Aste57867_14609 [Aphanomyces stellatus]